MNRTRRSFRSHRGLRIVPLSIPLLVALGTHGGAASAATPDLVTAKVDAQSRVALDGNRPRWATAATDVGTVPAQLQLKRMTVLLKRPAERQRAFDALLQAQQDPKSPDYHRWLTPEEIGERFGPSQHDVDAVADWLASRSLQVESVSATRTRIRFSGNALDASNAFATSLGWYQVGEEKRIAPKSSPQVPAALASAIETVHGLESMNLQPLHRKSRAVAAAHSAPGPAATQCNGDVCTHFMFPADFTKIYNVDGIYAQGYDGRFQSIAIPARTRVADDDVRNFQRLARVPIRAVTTIIPPDGIDPGPAVTTCSDTVEPMCDDPSDEVNDQSEATLDVQIAGSIALASTIKLITSGDDGTFDGLQVAVEYAIDASPPPARILSISYGTCEADNSAGNATYLDALFGQAAMEGISVFVSSGDGGVTDCADHHAPPSGDTRKSTNLLCASGHVTCVGGTQFADTADPDQWWFRTSDEDFGSARGYIQEGAWNEPLDRNGARQIASSGGGVSHYLPTPPWQVGLGVPIERSGRYLPDVSFNAAAHTGYFTCMAATGAPCTTAGGSFTFQISSGTSASAPAMAAIAALLDNKVGSAQGNLNPRLYALAANPGNGVFHDVTVASSDVTDCDLSIPSLCNNSTPDVTGTVSGFTVGSGYDQVTGWGSLDAARLLDTWSSPDAVVATLNQHGLTGSWANRATASQGFVISVEPDFYAPGTGLLFGGWFAFDTTVAGGQRWYTIQGQVGDQAAATMPIYSTTGGRFDSSQATTIAPVGEATISFRDCSNGTLDYRFSDGSARSGSIPLTRLLANVSCAPDGDSSSEMSANLLTGGWADSANSGQGLVIDIGPAQNVLFGAWYTYAANATPASGPAGQRWYTLQATLAPGTTRVNSVGIYDATGGVFDQSSDTETRQVGTGELTFHSCSSATLVYRFNAGANSGHNGTLDMHRVTPVPPGCHL